MSYKKLLNEIEKIRCVNNEKYVYITNILSNIEIAKGFYNEFSSGDGVIEDLSEITNKGCEEVINKIKHLESIYFNINECYHEFYEKNKIKFEKSFDSEFESFRNWVNEIIEEGRMPLNVISDILNVEICEIVMGGYWYTLVFKKEESQKC